MTKKIGTHNGKFHADEAFAIAMLQMIPEYSDAKVTRTRDPAILADMDVVVDVGGVYDPSTHRYDHHQPTFNDTFSPEHKTLLSSAGLVYKHFGKTIIKGLLGESQDEQVETVYRRIYDKFVEPFDAHDNGVSAYPSNIQPLFYRSWDIFAQVNILNPDWNEEGINIDARFLEAVALVKSNFDAVLTRCIRSWLPARSILLQALTLNEGRESVGDDRIVVLDQYCPWTEHLFELEKSLSSNNDDFTSGSTSFRPIIYVIYEDSTKSSWRVHAVPLSPDSFECRKPLPQEWRGLRDDELSQLLSLEGCVFVHRAGFIGAHKTREGAIKMAQLSLSQ